MILITDGGSTKCDWILLDQKGDVVLKTRTKGLNPAVVPDENIKERILANQDLLPFVTKITVVDFFWGWLWNQNSY